MPDMSGGFAHYNLNDPSDMQALIESGIVWKGGPQTQKKAVVFLLQHRDLITEDVLAACPPGVRAILQPAEKPAEPESPAEDTTEPAEEPTSAPSAEGPQTPLG